MDAATVVRTTTDSVGSIELPGIGGNVNKGESTVTTSPGDEFTSSGVSGSIGEDGDNAISEMKSGIPSDSCTGTVLREISPTRAPGDICVMDSAISAAVGLKEGKTPMMSIVALVSPLAPRMTKSEASAPEALAKLFTTAMALGLVKDSNGISRSILICAAVSSKTQHCVLSTEQLGAVAASHGTTEETSSMSIMPHFGALSNI